MKDIAAARKEYTKQLMSIMIPIVYDRIKQTFLRTKKSNSQKPVLVSFQLALREYKDWSSLKVQAELNKMKEKASYFDDLITAIFITNVRIMSSIQIGNAAKKISLEAPSGETFVHDVLIRTARAVYGKPTLFDENKYKPLDDNRKEVYEIIRESIEEGIRAMLPVKSILDSYLSPEPEVSPVTPPMEPIASPELQHPSDLVSQADEIQPATPIDIDGHTDDQMEEEDDQNGEKDDLGDTESISEESMDEMDRDFDRPMTKNVPLRDPRGITPKESIRESDDDKETESKTMEEEPFFSDADDEER